MEERKLYHALGLHAGAGLEEIKKAYRSLAKQYHPDFTQDPTTGEEFRKVTAAYKILSVREKKRKYVDFPVEENTRAGRANNKAPKREPDKQDIHSLGKLVTEGKVAEMRAFAAKRLGSSGKKSAYIYLKRALFDESEMVVQSSVEAVGRLRVIQSAGDLACVYSEGSHGIKMAVLEAVEKIAHRQGFSHILVMGMKDDNREIRNRALSIFARLGKEGVQNERTG